MNDSREQCTYSKANKKFPHVFLRLPGCDVDAVALDSNRRRKMFRESIRMGRRSIQQRHHRGTRKCHALQADTTVRCRVKKLAGSNTNHVLRIKKDRCFERPGRPTEQHCDLASHSTSLSKYSWRRLTARIQLKRPRVLYPQTSSGESLVA